MATETTESKQRDKTKRTAFISAPMSANTGGIRGILQRHGIEAFTERQIILPGSRLSDILQEAIGNAEVVLAIFDSGANGNVFFELGFAQALKKRTLILVDADVDPPFIADVGATFLRTKLDNTQAIEVGISQLFEDPPHGTSTATKQTTASASLADDVRGNVGQSPETKLELVQTANGDCPIDGDWSDRLNERRIELIDKDIQGNVTQAERTELEELQRKAVAYRDRVAPLPIDGARRLHQHLLEMKRQREGS